jgi:hypothetical protein
MPAFAKLLVSGSVQALSYLYPTRHALPLLMFIVATPTSLAYFIRCFAFVPFIFYGFVSFF